jgi:transcriptional regulator with XRE-family HTH domain
MAEKLHIHVKTWKKIENSVTRLDLERLQQIADIFEIPIEDLINTEDSVYINNIKDNNVGFNNATVTINETALYEKLLEEKDKTIETQTKYIAELEAKLKN